MPSIHRIFNEYSSVVNKWRIASTACASLTKLRASSSELGVGYLSLLSAWEDE